MPYKKSTWTGKLYQSVLIALFSTLFNAITIYLFYPVTVAMKERWICNHTNIDGKDLIFVGKAGDLMKKWLLWWFLAIITISIFGFFIPDKMQKWKTINTHFKTNN